MTARKQIADKLAEVGASSIIMLVGLTELSRSTVARELAAMEADGMVSRKSRPDPQRTGSPGFLFELVGAEIARQGHVYLHQDRRVLALQTGKIVTVAEIKEGDEAWPLQSHYVCNANALRPLPMRYFHGQTPR